MNSRNEHNERALEKHFHTLNQFYLNGLQILNQSHQPEKLHGWESQLQEVMSSIQSAEIQSGWTPEEMSQFIQKSERLQTIANDQKRLISLLLKEIEVVERELKCKRETLLPRRDHQQQVNDMKAAYLLNSQ